MDSLFCGKATPVETVHRTVSKSRLSSPFWRLEYVLFPDPLSPISTYQISKDGGPTWTRTIDLTIISRVL